MAAFAQDRGLGILAAGNLLAFMGLTGLAGVIASGVASDRLGPVWPTAAAFAARIVVFAWIAIDQSPVSIAVFALVFGATFLVTAPLTVVFVRESFGTKNLGALTGLITMVHQIFGGVGAYAGAAIFDATGTYDAAFLLMLASAVVALALTLDAAIRALEQKADPRSPADPSVDISSSPGRYLAATSRRSSSICRCCCCTTATRSATTFCVFTT